MINLNKVLTVIVVMIAIITSLIVLKVLLDLSIGLLYYIITNPLNSMIGTIGLMAMIYSYYKLRSNYRR